MRVRSAAALDNIRRNEETLSPIRLRNLINTRKARIIERSVDCNKSPGDGEKKYAGWMLLRTQISGGKSTRQIGAEEISLPHVTFRRNMNTLTRAAQPRIQIRTSRDELLVGADETTIHT